MLETYDKNMISIIDEQRLNLYWINIRLILYKDQIDNEQDQIDINQTKKLIE